MHSSPNLAPSFATELPCTHCFGNSCPLRPSSSPLDTKALCLPTSDLQAVWKSSVTTPKTPLANRGHPDPSSTALSIGGWNYPQMHTYDLGLHGLEEGEGTGLSQLLLQALPAPSHCPLSFLFLPMLWLCQLFHRASREVGPWGKQGGMKWIWKML